VRLVTGGVYRLARHPIYGGVVLLAAGWSLARASIWPLLLSAVLAAFLLLKSRREEAWLSAADPAYDEYRRLVRRRMLPFLF
jgi:protein-S-isoprenylcysteine O-methyltransferase Ste14